VTACGEEKRPQAGEEKVTRQQKYQICTVKKLAFCRRAAAENGVRKEAETSIHASTIRSRRENAMKLKRNISNPVNKWLGKAMTLWQVKITRRNECMSMYVANEKLKNIETAVEEKYQWLLSS
jgi:hypothetical protein